MDWKFPSDVRGWLSEAEGRKLAELARGKRVLEIGSYEGRSTICMAQVAARVDCIDPGDGRATTDPGEHLEALKSNLARYGLKAEVRVHVGTTDECAPDLEPGYDLIFIDGNHEQEFVEKDIQHAKRLLAPGGLLAFHDYRLYAGEFDERWDPGVTFAVQELIANGAILLERAHSLAVVKPYPADNEKPQVFCTMPSAGRFVAHGAAQAIYHAPTFGRCLVAPWSCISSGLDRNFNHCFAEALNVRLSHNATHWALLHADVCPENGWIDTLLGEMARTGAGFVSAVVPLKDSRGMTSTALMTDDIWLPRRLSLKEVFELPETFGDEQTGGELLLNTGCCLFDLGHRWIQDILEGAVTIPHFQTLSRIVHKDGKFKAQNRSEDWEWSRELRLRGVKQVATRKIRLKHAGEHDFENHAVWGGWETDIVHAKRVANQAEPVEAIA